MNRKNQVQEKTINKMFERKQLKFLEGSIIRIYTIKLKFCFELLSKPKKSKKAKNIKRKLKSYK